MDFSRFTSKITPRRIVISVLLVVAIWLLYWIATHGFVEVSATDVGGGDVNYQLLDQSSMTSKDYTSKSATIKKLVSKSSYEVMVRQADTSSLTVVHSKGFLGTSKVAAALTKENARRLVADKPRACMAYAGGRLYSYVCGDSLNNLNVHVAATDTSPTYAQKKVSDSDSGFVESIIETKEGVLALTKLVGPTDIDDPTSHTINVLNPDLSVARSVSLGLLAADKSYTAKPYKEGFLVYSSDFSQTLYYSSAAAQPVTITVEKPKTKDLAPTSITTRGNQITVLFTHSSEAKDKKPASEVVVSDGATSKHYILPKNYTTARTCGQQSLCLVGLAGMDVYGINKDKARYTYSVSGVLSIDTVGQKLLAARAKDTLSLDVENRNGYISYSFGDYSYGGITESGDTYILSLVEPGKQSVALLVDQKQTNSDSIDKKLLELEKVVGVTSVSINNNHIFVVGNFGNLVFDASTGGFGYNQATKKAATTRINQAIDTIGIDRKSYTIVIN